MTPPPSNWDDQFDFDDLDDPKPTKKPQVQAKKKNIAQDDDFFDIDQEQPTKKAQLSSKGKAQQQQQSQSKSILPTIINPRQSPHQKTQKSSASSNKAKSNPFADKVFGGQPSANPYEDQYCEEQLCDQVINSGSLVKGQSSMPQKIKPSSTANSKVNANVAFGSTNKNNKNANSGKDKNQNKKAIEEQDFYNFEDEEIAPLEEQLKEKPVAQVYAPIQEKKQSESQYAFNKNESKEYQDQYAEEEFDQVAVLNGKAQKQEENRQDDYEDEYADDDFEPDIAPSPVKKDKRVFNKGTSSVATGGKPRMNNLTSATGEENKPSKPVVSSSIPPKQSTAGKIVSSNKYIGKVESRSVNKKLERSNSRHSIRSQDSRKLGISRITNKNQSQYLQNRHQYIVEKSFPQTEDKIMKLKPLQINKMNQRMRVMIKKFNEELNDLISKNMILLKNKSQQKQASIQERIRELEIQKGSGQTAINVMEKEFGKLQGRTGELREEEYQLILERQIDEETQKIKERTKEITVLKRQVDTKGKKLSVKEAEQKEAQIIHHLKTILISTKKEQVKSADRIQKLAVSHEELESKLTDIDYKLDELIGEAKEKGVSLENHESMERKNEELKRRLENAKHYNLKSQNLISTKIDIVQHQNDQIKISIRNLASQINNLYGSIDHSQNEAIKIIEKAKQKTNITPIFADGLDKLLKQIEQSKSNSDYQVKSEAQSRRSTTSKPLKNSNLDNIEKSTPLRSVHSQNKNHEDMLDDPIMLKPKFTKKKPNESRQSGEPLNRSQVKQDRYWNDEDEQNKKQYSTGLKLASSEQPTSQKPQPAEEKRDKNKPFMLLKKNKPSENSTNGNGNKSMDKNDSKPFDEQPASKPTLQIPSQEQDRPDAAVNINVAPRMMRFGKKNKESATVPTEQQKPDKDTDDSRLKLALGSGNQGISLPKEQTTSTVEQQVKPLFAPKRFNMRNNRSAERKQQQKVDSYIPSMEANTGNGISGGSSKQNIPEQPYKPKFEFKNQQPLIFADKHDSGSNNNKLSTCLKDESLNPPAEQSMAKPKFRLRDRAKKTQSQYQEGAGLGGIPKGNPKSINDADEYVQPSPATIVTNPFSQKKQESTSLLNPYAPKSQQQEQETNNKNSSNPYAPKKQSFSTSSNPYAPKQQVVNPYAPKQEISNPYAPKQQVSNPYAPKQQISNPYAHKQQGSSTNPYAPTSEAPKRERAGPLKKNKMSANNLPKQSLNIYDQAEDITSVNEFGAPPIAETNNYQAQAPSKVQTQELDLNTMLGIKKDSKKANDFDDLLGDMGGVAKKSKKKNQDFFNDLDL